MYPNLIESFSVTTFFVDIFKQEIELSFNSISHIGMQRFCEVMNDGYSSMTRLLLDNNKLGDKGAKCLAGSLLKLNLVELNIGFNGIEPEGLIEIINAIYTNPTIETLTLSGNNITNTVSKVIANMLLHNYNLRQLFLDHTNIGPVGEKYISAGIATNKRSGVRILTGFQLGKVLVSLGSPPHLSDVSNETALTYLSVMWAAHNSGSQTFEQVSDLSGGATSSSTIPTRPSDPIDNRLSHHLPSTAAPTRGTGPQRNNAPIDYSAHSASAGEGAAMVVTSDLEVESSEVYPPTEITRNSNSSREHRDADSKSASNSNAVQTFPFLNKFNDQLTGKEDDIDMFLSYADRDRILRTMSCNVDINIMNISISQSHLPVSSECSTGKGMVAYMNTRIGV